MGENRNAWGFYGAGERRGERQVWIPGWMLPVKIRSNSEYFSHQIILLSYPLIILLKPPHLNSVSHKISLCLPS